ncbi:hypothetical protein XHC_1958 [Xanthomonas hortorum pv. carotae str. M081]|nr:hypothetical protein XHC_1958 [Xanthomonas hortorum pv. carotae str. M081]
MAALQKSCSCILLTDADVWCCSVHGQHRHHGPLFSSAATVRSEPCPFAMS